MNLIEMNRELLAEITFLKNQNIALIKANKELKKQLRIGGVVKSFYCFEQSMNGYDKCGDQCNYCKSLNIA